MTSVGTIGATIKNKGGYKPDDDGYYRVIFGVIGIENDSGVLYENTPEVRALYEEGSEFITSVSNGYIRSEQGHPKRQPGMTKAEFAERMCKVYEQSICGHVRNVELLDNIHGHNTFTVVGYITPAGPFGPALKNDLDNPYSNTAFSSRVAVKKRKVNGRLVYTIKNIITYDFVVKPGISKANKVHGVALESHRDDYLVDMSVTEASDVLVYIDDLAVTVTEAEKKSLAGVMSACGAGKECIFEYWDKMK